MTTATVTIAMSADRWEIEKEKAYAEMVYRDRYYELARTKGDRLTVLFIRLRGERFLSFLSTPDAQIVIQAIENGIPVDQAVSLIIENFGAVY